jgi:hypothetical protein
MIFLWDILLAVGIAAVLTLVFALGLRRRGPWSSILLFFLVVFLGAWTASVWIPPIGPPMFGVFWVSPLLVALILALLLAAAFPARPRRTRREEINLQKKEVPVVVRIDAFFIILLVVFAAVILIGYLR